MTDDADSWLEEVDTSRSSPGTYLLNGKDRKYCITGKEQGSIKKSELESRIKNKRIKNIPQRIQDLFDDVALIHHSDTYFLSFSEKNTLSKRILDSRLSGRKVHMPNFHLSNGSTRKIKFGVELGSLLRYLNVNGDINRVDDNLVWGFILGLHGCPPDKYKHEAKLLEELLSQLEEKRIGRKNNMKQYKQHQKSVRYENIKKDQTLLRVLNEEGVTNISSNSDWFKYIKKSVYNAYETTLRDAVKNLIDVEKMRKMSTVKTFVEEDIVEITNKQWRKQDADEIIEELWLYSRVEHKNMININQLNSPRHQELARKLINEFSSKEKHGHPTHYPIIEQKNNQCKLTEYGNLVSYCIFENDKKSGFIHAYGLFDSGNQHINKSVLCDKKYKYIRNALDEVEGEIYRG